MILLGFVIGISSAQKAQAQPIDQETCFKAAQALAVKLTQEQPEYKFYPEANYSSAEARCYMGIQKYGPHGADGKYGNKHNEELILYDGQTGAQLAIAIMILTNRTVGDVAYETEKTGIIFAPTVPAD